MGTITAGYLPTYSDAHTAGYTRLEASHPASGSGVLTSFSLRVGAAGATGVKMGTFVGSGVSWTCRDFETLGAVSGGSTQTFTGLSCSVVAGDLLGFYGAGSAGLGYYGDASARLYVLGDAFSGTATYTAGVYGQLLYGEGSSGSSRGINNLGLGLGL